MGRRPEAGTGRVRCRSYPFCSLEDLAMRTYDFSPLWRSTVGFDRLFDLAESAQRATEDNYPPSLVYAEHEEANQRRAALGTALNILTPRERCIFEARYLSEPAAKLEALSKRYGVSRERVRQIEIRSFEKVPAAVRGQCKAQPPAASKEFEMH